MRPELRNGWEKVYVTGGDYGYRVEGYYVAQTPKKWWHLYAQLDDGGWRHVAGGFTTPEMAMAATKGPG